MADQAESQRRERGLHHAAGGAVKQLRRGDRPEAGPERQDQCARGNQREGGADQRAFGRNHIDKSAARSLAGD